MLQHRFVPGRAVIFVMAYVVEVLFVGLRQASPSAAIHTRETVQARDRSNYVENVRLLCRESYLLPWFACLARDESFFYMGRVLLD